MKFKYLLISFLTLLFACGTGDDQIVLECSTGQTDSYYAVVNGVRIYGDTTKEVINNLYTFGDFSDINVKVYLLADPDSIDIGVDSLIQNTDYILCTGGQMADGHHISFCSTQSSSVSTSELYISGVTDSTLSGFFNGKLHTSKAYQDSLDNWHDSTFFISGVFNNITR